MASQNAMFLDDPMENDEGTSASCPSLLYQYGFVILFNWNETIKNPFKMFPRQSFSTNEISDKCMIERLKDELRIRKLKPMKHIPGQKVSLFAKVENCKKT